MRGGERRREEVRGGEWRGKRREVRPTVRLREEQIAGGLVFFRAAHIPKFEKEGAIARGVLVELNEQTGDHHNAAVGNTRHQRRPHFRVRVFEKGGGRQRWRERDELSRVSVCVCVRGRKRETERGTASERES